MTIDEMKVVITADNSDISKKIKDLNNLIDNFKNKSSSSFAPDTRLLEKSGNQLKKVLDSLSLNQKQNAEKNALYLAQTQEKEFLRRKFYESMLMSQEDMLQERHAMTVKHLNEKNALSKEQSNERIALKELQLMESNAKTQINLAEKTRQKQQEMYEKKFVDIRVSERNKIEKENEIARKELQQKEDMYKQMFIKIDQEDKKRIQKLADAENKRLVKEEEASKKAIEIALKERHKKEDIYKQMFIKLEQEDKKHLLKLEETAKKEVEIARKVRQQKEDMYKQMFIKIDQMEKKKATQKSPKVNKKNDLLSTISFGKILGIGALTTGAVGLATIFVNAFKKTVKDGLENATASIETESLFQMSMGKYSDEVRKWSEDIGKSLGLNDTEMRKNTAQMYHMITSMKIADETAVNMAKGVTLLAKDVSAFRHEKPEQVYERIQAGLMGQTRGLHLMGYAVTEANVKMYAYSHGITEVGKKLTEQEKVVSRYLLLMEQTRQTHGKFASTLNSVASQTAILKAQQEALSRSWGELFIPMLNSILPRLIAFAKSMKVLVEETKAFFGIKSSSEVAKELTKNAQLGKIIDEETEDASDNVKKMTDNLKKANKEAQKQLATFDEMNVVDKKNNKVPKAKDYDYLLRGMKKFSFPVDDYTQEIQKAIENAENKANDIFDKWQKNREENTKNFKESQRLAKESWNIIFHFPTYVKNLDEVKKAREKIANTEIPKWDQGIEDAKKSFKKLDEERKKAFNESQKPRGLNGQLGSENPIGLPNPNELNNWEKLVKQKKEEIAEWFKKMPYDVQEAITKSSNEIQTWFNETGSKTSTWFAIKKEEFKTWSNEVGTNVGEGFSIIGIKISEIGEKIKTWFAIKKEEFKTWAKESADSIGIFFSELPSKIFGWFAQTGANIKTWFATKKSELTTWASEMAEKIGKFFANIPNMIWNSMTSTFEKIKTWFAEKWSNLTSFISGGSKNSNSSSYYLDPRLQLPRFATGGIVSRPTYAQVGENGAEAIVPLENNTGWIDMLASKLSGNSGQSINLTVKIGEESIINRVIDGINDKSMEMGRGLVMV